MEDKNNQDPKQSLNQMANGILILGVVLFIIGFLL